MDEFIWYNETEVNDVEDSLEIDRYDITSTPNDFNITTIFSFIEKGIFKIPGFQRNYVWDIKRASKLIESIILGLPIPQIFLYEESRNNLLVIDGQQRLLSIYYFLKERFPKAEKRVELREIFDKNGKIPDEVLENDEFFTSFTLKLESNNPDKKNRFNKLKYSSLGEYQNDFDLRTIRNMVIKQNKPEEDHSSIFEIFNRLNSGGYNLKPQEIRSSLFHSDFYTMLHQLNLNPIWRKLLDKEVPDVHVRDVEFLLRAFAMLYNGESYQPSMNKFLNRFSGESKKFSRAQVSASRKLFEDFLEISNGLNERIFYNAKGFSISIFEAVFTAVVQKYIYKENGYPIDISLYEEKINILKNDSQFLEATQKNTVSKNNVSKRMNLAKLIISE